MNYHDGQEVRLGDTVSIPVPTGEQHARVVMLGDSYTHLPLDPEFLRWVGESRTLDASAIVVAWLKEQDNPFSHNDPEFAPVGPYMFSAVDEFVVLVSRDAT